VGIAEPAPPPPGELVGREGALFLDANTKYSTRSTRVIIDESDTMATPVFCVAGRFEAQFDATDTVHVHGRVVGWFRTR
jgi:hypothetical protein